MKQALIILLATTTTTPTLEEIAEGWAIDYNLTDFAKYAASYGIGAERRYAVTTTTRKVETRDEGGQVYEKIRTTVETTKYYYSRGKGEWVFDQVSRSWKWLPSYRLMYDV